MKSIWSKIFESQRQSPEKSNREIGKMLDIPASTVNYHTNRQKERNQYEESLFWESQSGQNFLKRLIIGVLYTFGIKGVPYDTTALYPPHFSNIYIKDLTIQETKNSIRVFGWQDVLTENISFDNIQIKSAKQGLRYNFVKKLQLKNVSINGKRQYGTYEKQQKGELPPEQT
ncbi:MAG: hypothetical protein AAGI49_08425 [Bacteroidota bacterium]